jgi:DNA-binding NarL/FixJ family response regulator
VEGWGRRPGMVRVVESVPMRLMVADHELGVVAMHDAHDPAGADALLVRPGSLLDGLVALFELLWRGGHPLVLGEDDQLVEDSALDELDREVLVLLLAGLTDQSTARQLGLSLRTVQRRARSLMNTAGVSTRLQLGFEVARRGWV